MELNREQIIKALQGHIGVVDMRCEECPYNQDNGSEICIELLMTDALALITSQEQRIKELTEELTRKETEYNELYELCESYRIERDAMRGAANSYKLHCKTLEKENESLKTLLDESFEAQNTVKADTVRKMHSMLCEGRVSNDNVVIVANQVAKEMLEGK